MNKTRSHLHMFLNKLNLLIVALNLHRLFVTVESTTWIFFLFQPNKICVSPTDVVSSLFPLRCRLSSDRCHCTVSRFFPIEPIWTRYIHFILQQCFISLRLLSSRNWRIEFAPPQQATLSRPSDSHPQLIQKDHLNHGHYSHHSITSLFFLLTSQSTTSSELHPPSSFPFTVVSRPSSLHTMTLTLMN
jgi:hypothetical protein